MLQRFVRVGRVATNMVTRQTQYPMSDKWKEREDAAENLYISQRQKGVLKKLLQRVKESDEVVPEDANEKEAERKDFEMDLRAIFKKHGNGVKPSDELIQKIVDLHLK